MARTMQTRTHGSNRAAKRLCRVGIADVLEIAQHNHFAISGGKPHDRASQVLHLALTNQILGEWNRLLPNDALVTNPGCE